MLILSWNVRFKSPKKIIKKIQSEHPDIVTLQEITLNQTNEWVSRLKDIAPLPLCKRLRWPNQSIPMPHRQLLANLSGRHPVASPCLRMISAVPR